MQRLTMQHADGWTCWLAYEDSHFDSFVPRLETMSNVCQRHGRDPATLPSNVVLGVRMPDSPGLTPGANPISGSPEKVAAEFQRFQEAGVDQLVLYLEPCNEHGLE